jgi:hypothetical protein
VLVQLDGPRFKDLGKRHLSDRRICEEL